MISIKIYGLDKIIASLDYALEGEPTNLEILMLYYIFKAMTRLYNYIINDQTIPQKYRDSLALAMAPARREVFIGPVWKAAKAMEKGRLTTYIIYKCPILKYRGGKLVKRTEAGNYLTRAWENCKDEILSEIKREIANLVVRSIVGG